MKTYKITISPNNSNAILSGEFEAKTKKQAIADCLDFYECELDTLAEAITILEVKKVG